MNDPLAHQPRDLKTALEMLRRPNTRAVAGCTDYMVQSAGMDPKPVLVDLLRLPELQGITVADGVVSIGAATTFTTLKAHPVIVAQLPTLSEVSGTIGAWQIQNRATIGGNIANASPAGDSLPVLLSLGASLTLVSSDGERSIPYSDMHVSYRQTALKAGEIIQSIQIPLPPSNAQMVLKKVGTREAQAISKILIAFYAEVENNTFVRIRIGAGSLGPVPLRLGKTEAMLMGQNIDKKLARAAAASARQAVTPIDDVRSTATYREAVLGQVIQRMVMNAQTKI